MKTIQISDEAYELIKELQQSLMNCNSPQVHAIHITPQDIVPASWGDETLWISEDYSEKFSSEELFDHLFSENPADLFSFCQEELEIYPPIDRDRFAETINSSEFESLHTVLDYTRMNKLYHSTVDRQGAFSLFKSDIDHHLAVNGHHYFDSPSLISCPIYKVPKMEALLKAIKEATLVDTTILKD